MNLAELTGLLAGGAAMLTSLATYYGTVRSARKATADTWQDLSAEYKADRDAARAELKTIDTEYTRRFRDMDTDHAQQLTVFRARILALEKEVETLRHRPADGH